MGGEERKGNRVRRGERRGGGEVHKWKGREINRVKGGEDGGRRAEKQEEEERGGRRKEG